MPRERKTLKAWFLLFRPWSYTATLVPFLLGLAIGSGMRGREYGSLARWGLALASGIFFQAVVNLLNTWGDERSGVDAVPGAIRTTPQIHDGIISMRALFTAALACALLAAAFGLPTAFSRYANHAAWGVNVPLLATAFIGFLGATNYSTGVKFKYRGLGVPFVSFLMGPLETFAAWAAFMPLDIVEGGAGLMIGALSSLLYSLPVAALVGVIMHGNDMRDIPTDRAAGIRTLATTLGPGLSLAYYWACHVLPYLVVAFGFGFAAIHVSVLRATPFLLPFLALPLTVRTLRGATTTYIAWRRVCGSSDAPPSPPWLRLERGSGAVHCVYGVLYALALLTYAI